MVEELQGAASTGFCPGVEPALDMASIPPPLPDLGEGSSLALFLDKL
jgi:hypothetical protein